MTEVLEPKFEETKTGSHIWLVIGQEDYIDGWYFSDESEQLNGPFDTMKIAEDNLDSYCKWLDGPVQTEFIEGSPQDKYDAGYLRIFGKGRFD